MKKICILTCGGTITMKKNEKGALTPFHEHGVINKLLARDKIAKIDIEKIVNIDSTNMQPAIWVKLANSIKGKYDHYDGFVVTHGTDTMAYTASAISFALRNLAKPIVFTGSQKPVYDIASDAINNLLNAVVLATFDIAEVCILFGRKIIRGNRATKISESSLDAFDSPHSEPLGEIAMDISLFGNCRKRDRREKLIFLPRFDNKVIVTQLFPGLTAQLLDYLLGFSFKGIVLEAFGPGNVPDGLISFISKACSQKIPVIILSQCHQGITKMDLYEVGENALTAGAIPANDMTVEAAVTKLMWILAQTNNLTKIRKTFNTDLAGEVTIE